MRPKIKQVEVLENYELLLTFKNEEKRIYDAKRLLKYEFYKNIKNMDIFKTAKVVDGITIEWITGEDVDPDELYSNSVLIKKENVE